MAIEASIGTFQAKNSVPSTIGSNPPMDRNKPAAGLLALVQECQSLLHQRLTPLLLTSFQRLTGLDLHVHWSESQGGPEPGSAFTAVCPMIADLVRSDPTWTARCRECVEHCWTGTQVAEDAWFTGRCGAWTLCVATAVVAELPVLRLVVQATPETINKEPAPAVGVSDSALERLADAQALLRLVAHDLEMTLQAHLLARELHLPTPAIAKDPEPPSSREIPSRRPAPGLHAQHVVQAMLDYVRDHYQRPMALKEVAAAFGMNANYLSGLFHKATGTAFHRYVHAVRMSKAEVLLRDPRMRICDVASAVGYASPNHFRTAFKACEKLSPKAWLERKEAGRRPSWPGPWDQDGVEI